jgi:K+-sensing histidine kinase KdpD
MNPFPIVQVNDSHRIENGVFFETPKHCNSNFNHKCKAHYEAIQNKIGFTLCPYGFASYVYDTNGVKFIATCLNVKGISDNKQLLKHERSNENFPKFTRMQVEIITRQYSLFLGSYIAEKNKNIQNNDKIKRATFQHNLITVTLHELRKLNQQIKLQSEVLQSEVTKITCKGDLCKKKDYIDRAFNIFSTSQLISTRLNAYDFIVNPSLTDTYKRKPIVVFKKFEKAIHCLKLSAEQKRIRIELLGSSVYELNTFKIFELLPFMLLENALKYTPEEHDISCIFFRNHTIEIRNLGPKPSEKNLDILFENGKRSDVVSKMEGSGIGLYLSKLICDKHEIGISISIGDKTQIINNIEHADFVVTLKLKK